MGLTWKLWNQWIRTFQIIFHWINLEIPEYFPFEAFIVYTWLFGTLKLRYYSRAIWTWLYRFSARLICTPKLKVNVHQYE